VKQKVNKITKKDLPVEKRPQVKSILHPSRALSPRPKNSQHVNWPDIVPKDEVQDDDTQKQQEEKTCLSAAVNEVMVSFSLVLCCGGESETAAEVPPAMPPVELPPLETVYQLGRISDKNLTVKTDLLPDELAEYDEEDEPPIHVDPILSFRDKKLQRKNCDPEYELPTELFTFSDDDDDSILDERDELSTGGDDWAPVVRRTPPPPVPPPVLTSTQQKLRNDASLRYEELHDYLLQNREQTPRQDKEQTPHTKNAIREIVIPETQLPVPLDACSTHSWSMDDKATKRKSPRLFGFKPRLRKKQTMVQPRFAEIEWRNAPPPSPYEITHVGEIPWKTHEGRHVSKMKKEHLVKKRLERQPSRIQADLAKEWEEEIKQVLKSPPKIGAGFSSETEDDGRDKYNRSSRRRGGGRIDPASTGNEFAGPIFEI
jgi:hypothetical protein